MSEIPDYRTSRSERNRKQYLRRAPDMREKYRVFREFVDAYKMERGCIDCGYSDHPAALEFDHRDPSLKRQKIASMAGYSRESLLAELAKCDVRCSNCHRIKTFTLKESGMRGEAIWNR